MTKTVILVNIFVVLVGFMAFYYVKTNLPQGTMDGDILAATTSRQMINTPTQTPSSTLKEEFTTSNTLEEAGRMKESKNKNWWLNSGGLFYSSNGVGKTVQGELAELSRWRLAYYLSNPTDTDQGYHPQNIFRLVTRGVWKNYTQQFYFKIVKDNLSESPNRNASNGVLMFNRYQDGQTLYYSGVRVDGAVVIKKKYQGKYYTLAIKTIEPGKYDRVNSPDLIPKNIWYGIKTQVTTLSDNSVSIKLYIDKGMTDNWTLALSATDEKGKYGGDVILKSGFAGIRTDFVDAEFAHYEISESL